jgi:excinuclease ABC subunit C
MYELMENYHVRSEVVNSNVHNVDVFSIVSDEKTAYINYLHIAEGSINQAFTFEYKKKLAEKDAYLLGLGIVEMRERFHSQAPEIVVSLLPDSSIENTTYTVPTRGDRKKLLELSLLNVRQYRLDSLKQAEKLNPEQRIVRLLTEIKDQLHLEKLPHRIECFDNSHIQGSNSVCGCVVFMQGKAAKSEYRKYQIKEAKSGDDYESMREIARRRYAKAISEALPLPDLILVDGGKGQMEAMRAVVEDELHLHIPIVGLAKNRKHHTSEVLCGYPPVVLGIKQGTPLFRLLESIQTEVHRFALSYHQVKRSKSQLHSKLDDIKGIGIQTKGLLLKQYKSVQRIREAEEQELVTLIGTHRAALVKQALVIESQS